MTHNLPPTVGNITSADPLPDELEDTEATEQPAAPAGPSTAAAPTIASLASAALDFSDPAVQVILHVQRADRQIHLRMFIEGEAQPVRTIRASRSPSSGGVGTAGISLARDLSQDPDLKKFLGSLRKLAARTPDPWLCIDELGDTGIPWEMIPFDLIEKRPLGVDFIIWRRYEGLDDDGAAVPVEWGQHPVRGGIVSFCSKDVEDLWKTDGHVAKAGTFPELQATLGEHRAGTALVYVLCHFVLGPKSYFGRRKERDDAIDADFLNLRDLRLLREIRPIVFVNACGTNRVQEIEPYLHGIQPPLHDRFRALGATGVIGTVDTVEGAPAAATGERIIALARTRRVRVPELLRELRREVHARVNPHRLTPETAAEYFHAFAYIYLGAPGAYLVLE